MSDNAQTSRYPKGKEKIVFANTSWYYSRKLLMLVLIGFFAAYFFYDGYIAYPKKAKIYQSYLKMKGAHETLRSKLVQNPAFAKNVLLEKSIARTDWHDYAQKVDLADFYIENDNIKLLLNDELQAFWSKYTLGKGWPDEMPPKEINDRKILEQKVFGILCSAVSLFLLYQILTNRKKTLELHADGFRLPDGEMVKFTNISCVDKTKWEEKGLAKIVYRSEIGKNETCKLDCLRFGEESSIIMEAVLENLSGDLIDLDKK